MNKVRQVAALNSPVLLLSTKLGRFERTDKGTACLDETGELSLQTQMLLLRVLQE